LESWILSIALVMCKIIIRARIFHCCYNARWNYFTCARSIKWQRRSTFFKVWRSVYCLHGMSET